MKIPLKVKKGETILTALSRVLGGKEPTSELLQAMRRDQYKSAIQELRAEQPEASLKTSPIDYPRTDVSLDPIRPMRDAALALKVMEDALTGDNDALFKLSAVMFNMAAVELNETFKAAKAADALYLTVDQSSLIERMLIEDEGNAPSFYLPQWPEELWNSLTDEERSVCVEKGMSPDAFMSWEESPRCPLQPCPGCDLRGKVLDFRALIAADQRGEVPPGAQVH